MPRNADAWVFDTNTMTISGSNGVRLPNAPNPRQLPYVDPADPASEIYVDSLGRMRRRAVREGTQTMEQVQAQINLQQRAATTASLQSRALGYQQRVLGLCAQYRRLCEETMSPAYHSSRVSALSECVSQGNNHALEIGNYLGAVSSQWIDEVHERTAAAREQFELERAGYQAEYDAFHTGNPYSYRHGTGWRVRTCQHCGNEGSGHNPLVEVARTPYRPVAWLCASTARGCSATAECPQCHAQVLLIDTRTIDGVRVCHACRAVLSRRCDRCGDRETETRTSRRRTAALVEGVDGGMYCPFCVTNGAVGAVVHGHSWEPAKTRWLRVAGEKEPGDVPKLLYVGMEIETENSLHKIDNETGAKLAASSGLFYVKHDGSISDGFEMVSHPFTWAWLLANSSKLAVLQELSEKGFRGFKTNTCGMHVHLSKSALSSAQIYKLLKLVYGHPEFIALVSRRELHRLTQWANPNLDYRPDMLVGVAKQKFLEGKYRALNLSKDATAEVRIFRSTLSPNGVRMNLEFCKAAVDYTRDCSVREAQQTRAFVEYVLGKQGESAYRHLYAFMSGKSAQMKLHELGLVDAVRRQRPAPVNAHFTPTAPPVER